MKKTDFDFEYFDTTADIGIDIKSDNMTHAYINAGLATLNLITDNRNKIIDEYEYLPFVRHAKAVEYKQELEGLKKSLDMTKIHYITVMDEEKARIKAIEYEMDDCSHSLENWNVFYKNNKKQSRERLAALEKEEQEAKAKLENLITEFDSMVKQISDNIELCESKLRWYRG